MRSLLLFPHLSGLPPGPPAPQHAQVYGLVWGPKKAQHSETLSPTGVALPLGQVDSFQFGKTKLFLILPQGAWLLWGGRFGGENVPALLEIRLLGDRPGALVQCVLEEGVLATGGPEALV